MVLTHDIKWHGFDGENAANNPTIFDLTEGKVYKSGRSLRDQDIWGRGWGGTKRDRIGVNGGNMGGGG